MKVFKTFPKDETCPICKLNTDTEAVLIAIDGTKDGANAQAKVFHIDCIELWYYPDSDIVAQKF